LIINKTDEIRYPEYSSYGGAMGHVFLLLLGTFKGFDGDNPQYDIGD
jgi:hypothetical protein